MNRLNRRRVLRELLNGSAVTVALQLLNCLLNGNGTALAAGGRVKSGLHIDAGGTSHARLGYTAMRVMGVDTPSWGTKSNNTSKEIGEILV